MSTPVTLQEVWNQMIQNVGGAETSDSLLIDLMLDFSEAIAAAIVAPSSNATELQSVAISTTAPVSGQILTFNGTVWIPGSSGAANAVELQGRAISATAPASGQVLSWNGSAWAPAAGGGGGGSVVGGSSFPTTFTSVNPITPNTLVTLATLSIASGAGLVFGQAQFQVTNGDIDILIVPSGGTIANAITSTTCSLSTNQTVTQGMIGAYINPGSTTTYDLCCYTSYSGFEAMAVSEEGANNATGIFTIGG